MYPNWGQYKRADLIGQSSYIKNNRCRNIQ